LRLAERVAEAVVDITGLRRGVTIDLAAVAPLLFAFPNEEMAALTEQVTQNTIVIFASPTYKAAYTGMLKAFLDRYPTDGLNSIIAIAVMTGASDRHAMAPDTTLRPLLVELGASMPTSSLYFVTSNMETLDAAVAAWRDKNKAILRLLMSRKP
jgi:FMN reductase